MLAVGMPGYVWSLAAPCYMHFDNCMPHPVTGIDPWPLKKHFGRVTFIMEGQMGEFDAAEDIFELPELDSEEGVLPSELPPYIKVGGDLAAKTNDQEIRDYGVDLMGRRYARDIDGNRIIANNPRIVEIPREL